MAGPSGKFGAGCCGLPDSENRGHGGGTDDARLCVASKLSFGVRLASAVRFGLLQSPRFRESRPRWWGGRCAVVRSLKTQFWGASGKFGAGCCNLPDSENRGYGSGADDARFCVASKLSFGVRLASTVQVVAVSPIPRIEATVVRQMIRGFA
jgi:hypothetical protein